MRKFNKVFTAFVLILTMVMVLAGCTKKDEEERSSRRERRNRTEKEEEEEEEEENISTTVPTETEITPAEQATEIPNAAAVDTPTPTEEITPAPTEVVTPALTEVITPAPAVPDKYLAEFDTLDDLKFIKSEILGKKLKDVLDMLDNKYNFSIDRDSVIYVQNEQNSSVMYKLPVPGVSMLGGGGFTTLVLSYVESKTDKYNGSVIYFELCLTGSEEKSPRIIPELAEITYTTLYSTLKASLGDADFKDEFDTEDYGYYLWDNTIYGDIWVCGGHNLWGMKEYNDCLISFGIDESEIPAEDTENSDVEEYFKISKKTGFLWMDTSIWNVSYKVFTKLMGDAEITELQDWPHWGTGLQAAFLTDGKYEYACLFQKDKLVQVYMDLDEDMSSKVYDAAVKKYGNPYNAYMYWSGYPAYEWTVNNGVYQQHMEVYDEKNHYRQMYVSPDYSE